MPTGPGLPGLGGGRGSPEEGLEGGAGSFPPSAGGGAMPPPLSAAPPPAEGRAGAASYKLGGCQQQPSSKPRRASDCVLPQQRLAALFLRPARSGAV